MRDTHLEPSPKVDFTWQGKASNTNAYPECQGQDVHEAAIEHSISDDTYQVYCKTVHQNNTDSGVDQALKEYDVDVIMGTLTGRFLLYIPWQAAPLDFATKLRTIQ